MEPPKKMIRTEDIELKEMIFSMQEIFFSKLKSIEEKIDKISSKYVMLEKKINNMICVMGDVPVDVSCIKASSDQSSLENVTMYTEADFPDGSWLGDSDNPDFRVRCPITPKNLGHINNTCSSAEKMSLTLLDYLFSREVQASSNISGTGKYEKKQLDPYMIEGIKYHVTHKFGITESDWKRIKLNIDSKCRTAFRRKLKGMNINVRGEKGRPVYKCKTKVEEASQLVLTEFHSNLNSACKVADVQVERSHEESQMSCVLPVQIDTFSPFTFPVKSEPEVLHTEHGSIQVIQATEEQFELLKQNPNIDILQTPISSS